MSNISSLFIEQEQLTEATIVGVITSSGARVLFYRGDVEGGWDTYQNVKKGNWRGNSPEGTYYRVNMPGWFEAVFAPRIFMQ